MRTIGFVLVLLLSSAATVAAQTHPCDGTRPLLATIVEGTRTVGWCHIDKDANGNPANITSFAIYVGTVRTQLFGVTTNGIPNAQGLIYFSAPFVFTRGTYTVTLAAVNAQGEGDKSAPLALSVSAPAPVLTVPVAPTQQRIS